MERWNRLKPCLLSLWPGLPQLWRDGSLLGLIQALGFAFLLQLSVFTSLIWTETVGPVSRGVVCFCVLGFWLVFAAPVFGRAVTIFGGGLKSADREHLFRLAQREYLRGNWFQSERSLRSLLDADAGDVDARMMLSTLYRRVGRFSSAAEEMGFLTESHGCAKWQFEIFQEHLALARSRRSGVDGLPRKNDEATGPLGTEAA